MEKIVEIVIEIVLLFTIEKLILIPIFELIKKYIYKFIKYVWWFFLDKLAVLYPKLNFNRYIWTINNKKKLSKSGWRPYDFDSYLYLVYGYKFKTKKRFRKGHA